MADLIERGWNNDQKRFTRSLSSMKKPKKPATKLNIYRAEVLPEIKDKNPGLSGLEVTKMISEQYKSLSKEKLEMLSKEYSKKLKEFHRELLEWEKLQPGTGNPKNLKEIEKLLGKPGKPANQTNKFISNYMMKNENTGFKEAYEAWNNLPSAEKEALKKEFSKEFEAYKIELNKWEKSLSESDREMLEQARMVTMKQADVEKMLGRPTKPANHFAKFVSGYMASNENSGFKEASEAWNNLAEAKKELLKKDYNDEYKVYKMKLKEWEENLSESDREMLEKANKSKTASRRKEDVESKDMVKPKRPPNALNLFIKEYMADNKCLLNEAVKEWNNLSQKKKEVYEKKGKALMEVYNEELLQWERNMIAAEKTDLVRKSTLKSLKSE